MDDPETEFHKLSLNNEDIEFVDSRSQVNSNILTFTKVILNCQ